VEDDKGSYCKEPLSTGKRKFQTLSLKKAGRCDRTVDTELPAVSTKEFG
jgi:hypothetical protein